MEETLEMIELKISGEKMEYMECNFSGLQSIEEPIEIGKELV